MCEEYRWSHAVRGGTGEPEIAERTKLGRSGSKMVLPKLLADEEDTESLRSQSDWKKKCPEGARNTEKESQT